MHDAFQFRVGTFNQCSIADDQKFITNAMNHYKRIPLTAYQEGYNDTCTDYGPCAKNIPHGMKNGIACGNGATLVQKDGAKKPYDFYFLANTLAGYFNAYKRQIYDNILEESRLKGVLYYGSQIFNLRCQYQKQHISYSVVSAFAKQLNYFLDDCDTVEEININTVLEGKDTCSMIMQAHRAVFIANFIFGMDALQWVVYSRNHKLYRRILRNMYPLAQTLNGWHYLIQASFIVEKRGVNRQVSMLNTHFKPDTEIATLQALITRKTAVFNKYFQQSDVAIFCGDFNAKYGDPTYVALTHENPIEGLQELGYNCRAKYGTFIAKAFNHLALTFVPAINADEMGRKYYTHRRLEPSGNIFEGWIDHIFEIVCRGDNPRCKLEYVPHDYIPVGSNCILPNEKWGSDHRIVVANVTID